MVALQLARREGKTRNPAQDHLFIMQWLATAQKRKLFPKAVAQDILSLQELGKGEGTNARLDRKLETVWLVSSGQLTQQSELFRFRYLLDTLRTSGWRDYLLTTADWQNAWQAAGDVPAIYTAKDALPSAFTQEGKLALPFQLRFTGNISGIDPLLQQCGFNVRRLPDEHGYAVLCLLPDSPL